MRSAALLALSFLVLALTAKPWTASADPLVTLKGAEVTYGTPYYLQPISWLGGGGVSLEDVGGEFCPTDVVQKSNKNELGLPIILLSPANPDDEGVPEDNTNVNIKFGIPAICVLPSACNQTTVWTVDDKYVKIGGRLGETSLFRFRLGGNNYYELDFCPERTTGTCPYIGVLETGEHRRLAETNYEPLKVGFVVAETLSFGRSFM